MRLEDVMTCDFPAVGPADSVRDAARHMAEGRIKALPVCDSDRLVGILTDWDITCAAARHERLDSVPVSEVMTPDVVCAEPRATLDEASEIMGDHRLHHLCVREEGRFRGMVHLDVEWAQLGGLDVQAPMATFSAPV